MTKTNGVAGNLRRLAAAAGFAVLIGFGVSAMAAETSTAPGVHSVAAGGGSNADSGEGPNPCPPHAGGTSCSSEE